MESWKLFKAAESFWYHFFCWTMLYSCICDWSFYKMLLQRLFKNWNGLWMSVLDGKKETKKLDLLNKPWSLKTSFCPWKVLEKSLNFVCLKLYEPWSKDKYPSIFSPQMEAIVFIILQIFYATHAVLKIGEYPRIFPSFSWGIFTHVTHLDQSRASENIWWIISAYISHNPP